MLRGFYIKRKPSGQRERNPRISVDFITTLLPFKLSWILSVTYGIVVFGWTTASCCGKDFSVSGTHRKSIWKKKSQTSFSALSLTNLSLFCMRKGYQKVLSKDIGTQFNLVPPFPPVCPSPSLSLSFGVKTVIEMSHFTDNAYRGKRYFIITTTRKEEFSLTQFFLSLFG